MEKRIQTPLRAGKGILLDVHANKRDKISSLAAVCPAALDTRKRADLSGKTSRNHHIAFLKTEKEL